MPSKKYCWATNRVTSGTKIMAKAKNSSFVIMVPIVAMAAVRCFLIPILSSKIKKYGRRTRSVFFTVGNFATFMHWATGEAVEGGS